MIWILLTVLFLLTSVLLVWYILKLVRKMDYIQDVIEEHFGLLDEFTEHLDIVHKLNSYSADNILQNLFKHSRRIVLDIKKFKEIFPEINVEKEESEYAETNEE